ncbi:Calcium binding protein 39 (Mo25 protein) isoform 5-like protein [Camelus ferus]|nr:Calcium binding protein 39 (Mo25 protein) isoform 5-like protein [Camelus ferus]
MRFGESAILETLVREGPVKQAERSEAPVAAAMPFPFGKSHKSPADIVKNLKESMAVLEKQDISDKKAEKATEEVSKNLVAMKEILYGTNEKEPQTEAVAQLAQELYNSGLLSTLVADLQLIDFELLGELLLDRHNFTIMTKYISKPENLKLMMNLLRDKSRNIQFEAFHVFKVFVANPNKTQPILDILLKNQTKLIEFLSKFQNDRTEDEQFNDEKTYLVKQIRDLKRPAQQEA